MGERWIALRPKIIKPMGKYPKLVHMELTSSRY